MREHRRRLRDGRVQLTIDEVEVEELLVAIEVLGEADRDDRDKFARSVERLIDDERRTYAVARNC
jgi:hypothetical protein